MEIYVSKDGNICLSEIYSPIELKAEKETISIYERDGVFEVVRRRTPDAPRLDNYTYPRFCQFCGEKIGYFHVCQGIFNSYSV